MGRRGLAPAARGAIELGKTMEHGVAGDMQGISMLLSEFMLVHATSTVILCFDDLSSESEMSRKARKSLAQV